MKKHIKKTKKVVKKASERGFEKRKREGNRQLQVKQLTLRGGFQCLCYRRILAGLSGNPVAEVNDIRILFVKTSVLAVQNPPFSLHLLLLHPTISSLHILNTQITLTPRKEQVMHAMGDVCMCIGVCFIKRGCPVMSV